MHPNQCDQKPSNWRTTKVGRRCHTRFLFCFFFVLMHMRQHGTGRIFKSGFQEVVWWWWVVRVLGFLRTRGLHGPYLMYALSTPPSFLSRLPSPRPRTGFQKKKKKKANPGRWLFTNERPGAHNVMALFFQSVATVCVGIGHVYVLYAPPGDI